MPAARAIDFEAARDFDAPLRLGGCVICDDAAYIADNRAVVSAQNGEGGHGLWSEFSVVGWSLTKRASASRFEQ